MNLRGLTVTALLCFSAASLTGQDIHFSQFNASPLTLNPALAGKLECTYRAAVNYRNQWNAIPAPYETYSAAFDAALWKSRLGGRNADHEALGIGLLAMNDVSGDGGLSNLSLNAFLAYHKQLGDNHVLSVGFQGVYVQRGVDFGGLLFPDQIQAGGGVPTQDVYGGDISYFDANAGIHWSSFWDYFSFNLGGAYYHIMEPNETLLNPPSQNILAPRYVAHGGFSVLLGDYVSLHPSFLYMQQSSVNQLNTGASMGYHMGEVSLYGGVWHRRVQTVGAADAIIALVGIDVYKFALGVSYDVSVSEITEANNGKGGFELSLTFNGCIESRRPTSGCPTFAPKW